MIRSQVENSLGQLNYVLPPGITHLLDPSVAELIILGKIVLPGRLRAHSFVHLGGTRSRSTARRRNDQLAGTRWPGCRNQCSSADQPCQ